MMHKQKIVSLTLAGAISVGSCMPAMAVNTAPVAKSSFGSSLGISQNNATNTSKKDVLGKLREDELEQLEKEILETKQKVIDGITEIINIVRYNATTISCKIIEKEAKEQHEELNKELKKADIEKNKLCEEILENFEKAGMDDEEAADINIKKANENFNKLIEETNEKHKAIDQAMEDKLKEIEKITNETEKKLAITCDEIFKVEGEEIEAAFEEAKKAITTRAKTATMARLKVEIRKFRKKYLEISCSLQELGELIKNFTIYKKIAPLERKLEEMSLEPSVGAGRAMEEMFYTVKKYHEVLNTHEYCRKRINDATFYKEEQTRFLNINKKKDDHQKAKDALFSLYIQLKRNNDKTQSVFYEEIKKFNDKLEKHPEVLDMFKKLFGEKFETLIDASNQLIKTEIECEHLRVANSKMKEKVDKIGKNAFKLGNDKYIAKEAIDKYASKKQPKTRKKQKIAKNKLDKLNKEYRKIEVNSQKIVDKFWEASDEEIRIHTELMEKSKLKEAKKKELEKAFKEFTETLSIQYFESIEGYNFNEVIKWYGDDIEKLCEKFIEQYKYVKEIKSDIEEDVETYKQEIEKVWRSSKKTQVKTGSNQAEAAEVAEAGVEEKSINN